MADFSKFSKLIHARFELLSKHELFVTDQSTDMVWGTYLASFPEGSNPIYITRTEHDCSCCRQFVKNLGNVVAVIDGKVQSIWAVEGAESPYAEVAAAMDSYITSVPITGLFRVSERQYGAEQTTQLLESGTKKNWNHFHGKIANRHFTKDVGAQCGDYAASVQVFSRGLKELSAEAIATVRDLIDSKSLYRGEEHLPAIKAFQDLQSQYQALSAADRNAFIWANAGQHGARFRNTAIGTLIQDLSEGVDLEKAVRSFEAKVAPTNYKRPTALITPRMVQDAMKTIGELGLEDALQRRFARISDVSVNNVLWVDNSVKSQMLGGVADVLMAAAVNTGSKSDKAEDIGIEEFMRDVLPRAASVDVLVKGTLLNNFMSLTAPVHADSGRLFKWGNDFAWSYDGNITDSIKEKVKAAGGNVTNAKLRVSLAWFNPDDLDLYVTEPSGNVICFSNKRSSRTGGFLDVDMNAFGKQDPKTPVENISWSINVPDGEYKVHVHQYNQRSTSNVGFAVEVESQGQLYQLSHPPAVKGKVYVAALTVKGGVVTEIKPATSITANGISQDKWGIKTETFVKVNTVMFSPNYWDDKKVGNKHWFFILEGCKNPDPTRGIYNEFLAASLEKHRKVFEVLGDKTKCQPTDDQLSGVGFSSTQGASVTVRVKGDKLQKVFNIKF